MEEQQKEGKHMVRPSDREMEEERIEDDLEAQVAILLGAIDTLALVPQPPPLLRRLSPLLPSQPCYDMNLSILN